MWPALESGIQQVLIGTSLPLMRERMIHHPHFQIGLQPMGPQWTRQTESKVSVADRNDDGMRPGVRGRSVQ